MDLLDIISPELIAHLKATYRLNWNGVHGYDHWMRVYSNGMRMAKQNGANEKVVALFAFTHDMARESEGWDHDHGPRAALRIQNELQGKFFTLTPEELALLIQAVAEHTRGLMEADITVLTCWDSDRLDLGRVGIWPSKNKLCTPEARDPATLRWAIDRSRRREKE